MPPTACEDLLDLVDFSSVECLNQDPKHGIENALKQGLREDGGLFLESDTDEQLLMHIMFKQAVKVRSVCILGPEDGSAPKFVKIFINTPTLGFSEADENPATQQFDLTEENLKGIPVDLRFVKFQQVNTLTFFIESNQGDEDTTKITKIIIYGSSGETMNVSDIMKNQQQGG
ncbi:hypothetical protein BSKO_00048 [Bryopsis sp. KO-2023]|nr:hypothetical protein BSKO_00048 [Bryopsis sp. KO-2023]